MLRHRGGAIDGRGVKTIFVGAKPGLGHVAADIDYGNDYLTDIAFVTNEDWDTASRTAIALADTVLHEAGHTFGLHHVNTNVNGRIYLESMGFRYSQNSHFTMLRNFGLASGIAQSQITTVSFAEPDVVESVGSDVADQIRVSRHGNALELSVNGQKYALDSSILSVVVRTNGDSRDLVSNTVGDVLQLTPETAASDPNSSVRAKMIGQAAARGAGFELPEESHYHLDSAVELIADTRGAEGILLPSANPFLDNHEPVRRGHVAKQILACHVSPLVDAISNVAPEIRTSVLNAVARTRSPNPGKDIVGSDSLTDRSHDAVFADFRTIFG